jgi:Ran GTPase-activating protein (RanGAP) involved in mRNA processing and transport
MTLHQFKTLIKLTRMKPQSIATKGAEMVLVHGLTQVEAAQILDCYQSTISKAVIRLRDRHRLAKHVM